MRKLILPAFCSILGLLLSIGSVGTARYESASNSPTQYADDASHTAQTDDPVISVSSTPAPSEGVSDTLTPTEIVFDTPAPTEVVSDTPAPTEVVSDTPAPTEVVSDTPAPAEVASDTPAPSEAAPSESSPNSERALTLLYQNPELPNGCEITSLAMLLAWAGHPIDKVELSDNYLPMQDFSRSGGVRHGANPNQAFVGNPSSPNGWYCFEGPILEAGNAYLSEQHSQFQAVSLSEPTQEELERCLDDGVPLVVWVTLGYAAPRNPASFSWYLPDGSHYVPYSNLHCVVLAGWVGDDYQIADPIHGWQTVSHDKFWNSFSAMGRRAVAVLPVN